MRGECSKKSCNVTMEGRFMIIADPVIKEIPQDIELINFARMGIDEALKKGSGLRAMLRKMEVRND